MKPYNLNQPQGSSCIHEFLKSLGLPEFLVPPDDNITWDASDDGDITTVKIHLSHSYNRQIEIWSVSWSRDIQAVVAKNGDIVNLEGVSAAARVMNGLKVKVTKIVKQNDQIGDSARSLNFHVKPPMLPLFRVNLASSHFEDRSLYKC